MNNKLYIYDCLTKKLRVSEASFMTIGRREENVFRCRMAADVGGSFAIRENRCMFFPHSSQASYSLNGMRQKQESRIEPHTINLLVLARGCFICWFGDERFLPDFGSLNPEEWYVYDVQQGKWSGMMRLRDLALIPRETAGEKLVVFTGLSTCAFLLCDIIDVAQFAEQGLVPQPAAVPASAQPIPKTNEAADERREICCPHCWEKFTLQQVQAVAVHPQLRGDSILGAEVQQRFTPQQVDAKGTVLDAMGMAVREYACPSCHLKLPPFFSRTKQHIFSLIGIPDSGKTYYLTSMLHELEYTLPREFGIAFRDADPTNNAAQNAMRMRLFSATGEAGEAPERTTADGEFYEKVWKGNRYLSLPRPFIYNLSRGGRTYSLVMYDTAGEDCVPGRGEPSASTGHLSMASGIFFLFDPTKDAGFRKIIANGEEAKGKHGAQEQGMQALLLSETEMRLRTELGLPLEERLDVPLAVIIGKSDVWLDLLGSEPLLPSIRVGKFQPKFVEANSKRLRELLFNVSPSICTNAEAISTNVCYFAVSSFGETTEETTDGTGGEKQPSLPGGQVHPQRVVDPILWALHCKEPDLLRKTNP